MILEEWEGYLLVFVGNKVYLADSRAMATYENHLEYEWFYWELEKSVTCTRVHNGVLYLGTRDGIYEMKHKPAGYTEVTFTEENGQYVLYGESRQEATPTPDAPVNITNTYKAGVRYIANVNGRRYRFELDEDLRSVGETKDEIRIVDGELKVIRKIGDVVFTTEAPLGNVCRIPHIDTEFYIGQRIITIQTDCLEPAYLEYALSSDKFREKIAEKSSGSTVTGIRSKLLEQLTIPIPPRKLQTQFATFVEQVDKSKFDIQQSIDKLETLKKSLMQQYFG
jgi:hypothetical protein